MPVSFKYANVLKIFFLNEQGFPLVPAAILEIQFRTII